MASLALVNNGALIRVGSYKDEESYNKESYNQKTQPKPRNRADQAKAQGAHSARRGVRLCRRGWHIQIIADRAE